MTIDMRPTLVIGVGGTGSEIAERIYREAERIAREEAARADRERTGTNGATRVADWMTRGPIGRGLLRVLALDTSDYDFQRLRLQTGGARKIRFSSAKRIHELMKQHPEVSGGVMGNGWFYKERELPAPVENMTLLEGAGQVRMFTRLALTDAFKNEQLEQKLTSAVQDLTRVTNLGSYKEQINILMLGSLAGGTGCGSFLQLALALRNIGEVQQIKKVEIRGIFLMPDIYVFGAGMTKDQEKNVVVNSYAALRELNAVMQATSGNSRLESFHFEFMPGRKLEFRQMPFDLVTLIDYEMMNGQTLGPNIDHYKDLFARAAITQLFLPLGQEIDQRVVNSVQLKLAAVALGTTNSYASNGIFSITYPEPAVLETLTNRFAVEVLEGDWLSLDRAFRRRVQAVEERKRAGDLTARIPDRGETYIADLESGARDRRPLLAEIFANVHREDQKPDGSRVEHVTYMEMLDAFQTYVVSEFRNATPRVRETYEATPITRSQLEDRADLAANVRNRDNRLDDIWRSLEDAARQVPDGLYENYWANALTMAADEWRDHHLQRFIVASSPHLVEVRYFLYLLRRELGKRMDALRPEDYLNAVMTAHGVFEKGGRTIEGSRRGKGVLEQAEEIASEGIGRLLSGKLGKFSGKFSQYYNTSLENMRLYGETTATKRCYEKLLASVDELIGLLELLFGDLEALQEELRKTVDEDRGRHALVRGASTGNLYVYAGAEAKEAIWEAIKPDVQGQRIGQQGNARLVEALFHEVRDRRLRRLQGGAQKVFSVRELFQTVVIEGFCRKKLVEDLSGHYSMNVVQAVKRQAALEKRGFDELMIELVGIVARQSKPFVQLTTDQVGAEMVYWAMNKDSRKAFDDERLFDTLFSYEQNVNVHDEEEYDRNQLLCVHVRHSFPITAVSKLQPSRGRGSGYAAGRYDIIYREWIDEVAASDARERDGARSKITPHLDREWHKPMRLPEIFPDVDAEAKGTLYRDFVLALGLGHLRKEPELGDPAIVYYDPTKPGHRTVITYGQEIPELLKVFKDRPDLALSTRAGFDRLLEAHRRAPSPDTEAPFAHLQTPEVLAELLEIARNRASASVDQDTDGLIAAYFEVLRDVMRALRTDLDPARVTQLYKARAGTLSTEALGMVEDRRRLNADALQRIREKPQRIAEHVASVA